MKELPLIKSELRILVDDEDYAKLSFFNFYLSGNGYAYRAYKVGKGQDWKCIFLHKELLNTEYMVDHRDQNKLNNCKSNLRLCTSSQNEANKPKQSVKCSSKYKGVSWHKQCKKWKVQIKHNAKDFALGVYHCEIQAALVYDKKAKEIFGEFAYTNFVVT